MFLRLNISFSNSGSSRDSDWNLSAHILTIDYWFVLNFFRIDWSGNGFFPDDGSLNNSLFDDGL